MNNLLVKLMTLKEKRRISKIKIAKNKLLKKMHLSSNNKVILLIESMRTWKKHSDSLNLSMKRK